MVVWQFVIPILWFGNTNFAIETDLGGGPSPLAPLFQKLSPLRPPLTAQPKTIKNPIRFQPTTTNLIQEKKKKTVEVEIRKGKTEKQKKRREWNSLRQPPCQCQCKTHLAARPATDPLTHELIYPVRAVTVHSFTPAAAASSLHPNSAFFSPSTSKPNIDDFSLSIPCVCDLWICHLWLWDCFLYC